MKENKLHYAAFGELENAFYNEHYNLEISENGDLEATAFEDADMMPKIAIHKSEVDGNYYYSAALAFPVLDSTEMEFYDSIAYWMKRWSEIGHIITMLDQFVYNPSLYEDDEEENTEDSADDCGIQSVIEFINSDNFDIGWFVCDMYNGNASSTGDAFRQLIVESAIKYLNDACSGNNGLCHDAINSTEIHKTLWDMTEGYEV